MTDMFGQYRSQETRALQSIESSKYPDTDKDLEKNLHRLNIFVDYIAGYLQQMQKGVDQANQDVIGRTRDILGNMVILLGGGTITDVDFGDLQYYLPAIGALLGFDADTPFPINLFNAAEHFFLGYVVPLDSFVFVITDQINNVLNLMGINEEFITAFNELATALGELSYSVTDFFDILQSLLEIFGISDTSALGPFADLWHVVTTLLGGLNLQTLGDVVDPVFELAAPWIHDLALAVNALNQIIDTLSGGVADLGTALTAITNLLGLFDVINEMLAPFNSGIGDLSGFINFGSLWDGIDFLDPLFDANTAAADWIASLLGGDVLTIDSPLNAENLFGIIPDVNMGLVPYTHIGDTQPNLLTAPTFDAPENIQGAGIWTHDSTVGRTSLGAVKVIANGTDLRLVSNSIPVAPAQQLTFETWLKWTGLTFSGAPMKLQIVRYLNHSAVGTADLATPASPPSTQASWIQLQNSYTVPAGCDEVRLQYYVASTATAGSIWWDDASAKKTGTMDQSWITNLVPDLLSKALGVDLTNLMSNLGLGTATLTAIANRFTNLGAGGLFQGSGLTGVGSINQNLISGLITDLASKALGVDLTNLMSNLGSGTPTLAAITTRLQNLGAGGLFNGSGLTGVGSINQNLISGLITDLASKALGTDLTALMSNLGAGTATLAAITTRLQNVAGAGTFNIAGIPILPRTKVYGSDFVNLLADGGFENGIGFTPHATQGSIVTIGDPAVGGTKAYQVASNGAVLDSNFDTIDVSPGEVWYIECWVRKTTTGTTGTVNLGTTYTLDGASASFGGAPNVLMSTLTQNAWVKTTGQVTIPASKNKMFVRPSVRNDVPAGQTIQFDNVLCRKVSTNELVSGLLDYTKLGGYGGPGNMGATSQATWDQYISGSSNSIGTGSSLADVFNIANQIGSWAGLGRDAFDIAGLQNNKPFDTSLLPTGLGNMPLTVVGAGATPTTIDVTQTSTLLLWKMVPQNTTIGVVRWLGFGITNITDFRVNIWEINSASVCGVIYRSSNVIGDLAGTMQYNAHLLSTPLDVVAGDMIGIELVVLAGTGAHSVAIQPTWLPTDPYVVTPRLAAKRTGSGSMDSNPPPTTANLVPFTDFFNSEDPNHWQSADLAQSQVTIVSNRLRITPPGSSSLEYKVAVPDNTYTNFVGKSVMLEVPTVTTGCDTVVLIGGTGTGVNYFGFFLRSGGNLLMRAQINGVNNDTTVAYNATNHRWIRLRHDGTNLCWDTSPNGLVWNFGKSLAPGTSVWSSFYGLKLAVWQNNTASPGVAEFDNFNLPRSTAFTSITEVPWMDAAVETGAGSTAHSPLVVPYDTSQTYPIPSWCNKIDPVALGAGGAGRDGDSFLFTEGGDAGAFSASTTWVRGTHFTGGSITITIGTGGSSSGTTSGAPGGNTTITCGANTVTGTGGAGGTGIGGAVSTNDTYGDGAGSVTRNGVPYVGGVQETSSGTNGNAPGGGGSAGTYYGQQGGNGANGRAWARFYQ